MVDEDEIECRVGKDGVAHYEYLLSPRELTGSMSAAIALLQSFEGPARQHLRIEHDLGYDGDELLYVRWERKLEPEELAKRERDEREEEARDAAAREAAEHKEFLRLKAKYERHE